MDSNVVSSVTAFRGHITTLFLSLCNFQIILQSLWIAGNDAVNKSVSIDSSVGRDTEFTFSYTGTTFTLDVEVISPSGVNYTAGHETKAIKQMTIAINDTEVRCHAIGMPALHIAHFVFNIMEP